MFCFLEVMNDSNILDYSSDFANVRNGVLSPFKPVIIIARRFIHWLYWVFDSICPSFKIIFDSYYQPEDEEGNFFFAKVHDTFREPSEWIYAVLFSRCYVWDNTSGVSWSDDGDLFVRVFAVFLNMIIEQCDGDDKMGKNIISVNLDAAMGPH